MPPIIDRLVRKNIKQLKAYASARSTMKAEENLVLLDAAENPWSPFDEVEHYTKNLNRYPEPQPSDLLRCLATLYKVAAENLLITRGSEEAIRLLLQTFCDPRQDAIITCPPTFGMYPIEAQIHDVKNIQVPRMGEFFDRLNVKKIVENAKDPEKHVKIIFICNPGNPSSTALPIDEIEDVISQLASHSMVVIDEAYIEFADHNSFASLLATYPNLIILRTLSKSYGLAGLRCGAILAHSQVIDYLKKIIAAYPVPRPTQLLAVTSLTKPKVTKMQEKQIFLKQERDRMIAALKNCQKINRIYPSQTNFLCVEVPDVGQCLQTFKDNNILIRDRSSAIPHAVNIAVGLTEQNNKVIEILQSL